jgi:DsbC/DsbD-like thiol-disulfide interchange protein
LEAPDGFVVGDMRYPAPKRFITDYGFGVREAGFGYEGTVIHLIEVTPPETLEPRREKNTSHLVQGHTIVIVDRVW